MKIYNLDPDWGLDDGEGNGYMSGLCRMALGRLETLLFVDSNDPPPNVGLTAQNSCYAILRTQILRHYG